MTFRELSKMLIDTLDAAQDHLEYCSFGDGWERECAEEEGLPARIENTLTVARKTLGESKEEA